MGKPIKRGEIYFADLDPAKGSEQGGFRPVLMIQNNTGNRYSNTVIVACITSKSKSKLPTHVPLLDMVGLPEQSIILMEQIRTIDKSRLSVFVGVLDKETMWWVNAALAVSVGISKSTDVMTLCARCHRQFCDSDAYILRRIDRNQKYSEPCTMCSIHAGFDYEIIKK